VGVANRATSYRLDPDVKHRLEQRATADGSSERALLERLITEGLEVQQHPGIVHRDGRTGRRAALAVGPDVWEVASALRHTTGSAEERVAELAEQFDLHPRHIRVAIDFAAAHRDTIDAEIAANDEAAERARIAAQRRADLPGP
jgi:sarcosine oxidase gamma subunit